MTSIIEPLSLEQFKGNNTDMAMSELRRQLSGLGGDNGGIFGTTYSQFNDSMVKYVSGMVSDVLKRRGYNVIVPDDKIVHVMTEVYKTQTPQVGDIHSRFIIDGIGGRDRNDLTMILDKSIEIITSQITDEFDMIKQNQSFSVWNQILGDSNPLGIRRHPPIKLSNRGRDYNAIWNMKY